MVAIPQPGYDVNGTLFRSDGPVKRNVASSQNSGLRNVWHYLDQSQANGGPSLTPSANIGDGVVDCRGALAAAAASGPVVLPPGTYKVNSNLTLSNCICFDPGAKLKPASGVTITLSSGYSAEDTQHVFDISAGGTISVSERAYVTPEHFGAVADGSTNDFAAMKAMLIAARDSGAIAKAVADGRIYRIGSRIELDDTYDGLCIDFSGAWIKATNLGWTTNDVIVMLNGQQAYTGSARDYKHYSISIKSMSIDGDYDFAGFLADLEAAYDLNPTMSASQIISEIATAQSANGVLYNGITQYVNPSGTGSDEPTFGLLADRVVIRNIGKSGIGLTNPVGAVIKEADIANCAVHAFSADLNIADQDVQSGQVSLSVGNMVVDSCQTAVDLTTTVPAYQSTYATDKLGTAVFGNIACNNIINRTKIHGPWNLKCSVLSSGPQHRVCRYPVLDVVDGLPERRVLIDNLSADTVYRGVFGTARWLIGSIRLRRVRDFAISIYGESSKIDTALIDTCPLPYRGACTIGYIRYENTSPDIATYQCQASTAYPFYSEGVTKIDRMELSDVSVGVVSVSQTFATYAWYFHPSASGSYINSLSIVSTLQAWAASQAVVTGDLRHSGGKLWRSNSTRTTGSSFDVTEQANWTEVGRGDGKVPRAIYVDDNTSSDYILRIGKLTGNGFSQYPVHQYSYGAPPLKPSVIVEQTDAGSLQSSDTFALRNAPVSVPDASKLPQLKNAIAGMIVRTAGYQSQGDGGANEYIYRISSRPGTENAFQVYGAGTTDWWESTKQDRLIEDLGTLASGTQVFSFNDGGGIHKSITATGNIGLQFSATVPGYYTAIVQQDATGGRVITYATSVAGVAPLISTVPNEATLIPLFFNGTSWFHVMQDFSGWTAVADRSGLLASTEKYVRQSDGLGEFVLSPDQVSATDNVLRITRTDGTKVERVWDGMNFFADWVPLGVPVGSWGTPVTTGDKISAGATLVPTGGTMHLTSGATYLMSFPAHVSSMKINGNGAIVKRENQRSSLLTANASSGASSVTVADASVFRLGQRCFVVKTSGVLGGHAMVNGTTIFHGSSGFLITNITGNVVTFGGTLQQNVVIGNKLVALDNLILQDDTELVTMDNVVFDGNLSQHSDVLDWAAGMAISAKRLSISNCAFQNMYNECLIIGAGEVSNCSWTACRGSILHVSNAAVSDAKGVLLQNGYATDVCTQDNGHSEGVITFSAASHNVRIRDCYFENTSTKGKGVFGLMDAAFLSDHDDNFFAENVFAKNYGQIINVSLQSGTVNLDKVVFSDCLFDTCGGLLAGGGGDVGDGPYIKHLAIAGTRIINGWVKVEAIRNFDWSNSQVYWDVLLDSGVYVGANYPKSALPTTRIGGSALVAGDISSMWAVDGANPVGPYTWDGSAWQPHSATIAKMPPADVLAGLTVTDCGQVNINGGSVTGPIFPWNFTFDHGILLSVTKPLILETGTTTTAYMRVSLSNIDVASWRNGVVVLTGSHWSTAASYDLPGWTYTNVRVWPIRESHSDWSNMTGIEVLAGCIADDCKVFMADTVNATTGNAILVKGPLNATKTIGGIVKNCYVPNAPGSSIAVRIGLTSGGTNVNANCIVVNNILAKAPVQATAADKIESGNVIVDGTTLAGYTAPETIRQRSLGQNESLY